VTAEHDGHMAGMRWRHRAAVMAVLLALALVTTALLGLWRFATQDRPEVIDNHVVARTANAACHAMRTSVHELTVPAEAGVAKRVTAVRAQNEAVLQMLDHIRSLGPERVAGDLPMPSWISEWESLVRARELYAASLEKGKPLPLEVPPGEEGEPITAWMNGVGLDCPVPYELLGSR
jgi:hypothetical protein